MSHNVEVQPLAKKSETQGYGSIESEKGSTVGTAHGKEGTLSTIRKAYNERDIEASKAEHKKRMDHMENHGGEASDYVKALVFGGLDGIMTTFAIIAAAAGTDAAYTTVVTFGIANCLADAFSMGFGEFVSGSAERDVALTERAREEWEVENCFENEVEEMEEVYRLKGLSPEDAKTMVSIISKDPKTFVDFMMVDELGILVDLEDPSGPAKQGLVMFLSFVAFGFVPIIAYLPAVNVPMNYMFITACILTSIALMILGSIKGILTNMSVPLAACLMLFNGVVSGGVSYGVGVLVQEAFVNNGHSVHHH